MNPKPLPPLELLREVFSYEPETGVLWRRTTTYNRKLKCQVYADGRKKVEAKHGGYFITSLARRQLKAHRVCWALHYGEDPYPWELDHINRNRLDNRIDNLRKVTSKENYANRSPEAIAHVHSRKPVRITYPDGRGTIVTDSLITAARILNRSSESLGRTIARDGLLYWDNRHKPNGIVVGWAT